MDRIQLHHFLLILLLVWGLHPCTGFASNNSDSLVLQLQHSSTARDSLAIYQKLISAEKCSSPNQALSSAYQALSLAAALDDRQAMANISTSMGHVYFYMGIYDKSLESYSNALNSCLDNYDTDFIGKCLNNIGRVYCKLGIYNLALQNYTEAEKYYSENNNIEGLAMTYNNAGKTYASMDDHDQAIQYFNDVLDLPAEGLSQKMIAETYTNIGDVFAFRSDISLALDFYRRAVLINESLKSQRLVGKLHLKMGDLYKQESDYKRALAEYDLARSIFQEKSSYKELAGSYLSTAEVYINLKEKNKAISLINSAISIAREHHFLEILRDSYKLLSGLYVSTDNIHTAFDYYIKFGEMKDSIFNKDLSDAIAKTEIRNAFLKYEININSIEVDRTVEKYTRWFVIIILVLALITVVLVLSRLYNQRRANKILQKQRSILKNTLIELSVSEEKYKSLFSQANDAIFLMNHKIFTDCNDKTLEIFECKREDIIGHPPYDFSPKTQPDGKSSKEKAIFFIEECYKGKPQRFYWQHSKKDGSLFDAEVALNMIHLEGKRYVQAIVRNISERVRAEKEMVEAKDKAEKATESKTFFLAKMSHEIRTMLGGITSSSQLLENTKVDEKQSELLDIINISANNLLSIVNEILDLSKIEAGKIEIEAYPFSLRKTLSESVNTYIQNAKEKDINLFLSIHPRIPDYVSGDELRLKQILVNLLSNAVKFTDEGSITLEAAIKREYAKKYLVEILVTDTGIGIPDHKIKDMFAEYSQSDISISRKYG